MVAIARSVAAKDEPQLTLASASPRRRTILEALGLPYRAFPVDLDERPLAGEPPEAVAERLAAAKALAGARAFPGRLALGADTVVALGGEPLGKPTTAAEAASMLRRLRARQHLVITAVAASLVDPVCERVQTWRRTSATSVWMRAYGADEIEAYVATGDPFDKAGAYAIQHPEFRPVERIEGCFLTVVGLPLPDIYELLRAAEIPVPPLSPGLLAALCPECRDLDRLPVKRYTAQEPAQVNSEVQP